MATTPRRPADDPSSAPESGTVRDDTSGNAPSDRGNAGPTTRPPAAKSGDRADRDDPGTAGEER